MKHETYGKYLLRKPLLSTQILFNNNETKNLEIVTEELIENDEFITSIYWSSPELYDLIIAYKNGVLNKEKIPKLINTLKKYALRITTRSTPYGTMAGVSLKNIKRNDVENKNSICRKARIDMDFLHTLKSSIENHPEIRKKLFYKINNTAFEIGDYYRYQEPTGRESYEKYQLSSLEISEHISKIFKIKKLTFYDEIYNLFTENFDSEDINLFLDELIDSKFLVNELQLKITTDNTLSFIQTLKRLSEDNISEAKLFLDIFDKIEDCIKIIENTDVSYLPLKEIEEIKSLVKPLEINPKHLFHVDLLHSAESSFEINEIMLKDINSSLSFLSHFKKNHSVKAELDNFKRIFSIKYDSEEIPLTEILDDEFGIGFPSYSEIGNLSASPLIEGKSIKNKEVTNDIEKSNLDYIIDLIEQKKDEVIRLDEIGFNFHKESVSIDENCCIIGTPFKKDFYIQNITSPNPNIILGRFAILDKEIDNLCQKIRRDEENQNSEIIFAEIVFLPKNRESNIVRRTQLSEYEIPILGSSSYTAKQILLNDILVSVHGNEIFLRSKKLNKRIILKHSNAHNFKRSDNSAYNFLCALQFQNQDNINLSFNYTKLKKRFVPRIVFKNIILHRATWLLHENDIKSIRESNDPLSVLKDFIQKWNITKYVVLVKGDNELFIDTRNDSYLKLLISELKDCKIIQLTESISINENSNFNEQIVLPLRHKKLKQQQIIYPQTNSNLQRSFLPGSEWIYFKIYCNSNFSDELLSTEIKPILDELISNKIIKSAFFIRYMDPHHHIRLRLNLADEQSYSNVLQRTHEILNHYFQKKMIWNIQLDTYHRELNRYNPEYIEDTEKAFFADSMLILSLLQNEIFIDNENIKLFAAVQNVDSWLSLFDISLQEKLNFCKTMENIFLKEFPPEFKTHIKTKYRELSDDLNNFLVNKNFESYFTKRNDSLIHLSLNKGSLSNYIHMSINRWFSSEQRAFELMTYTFTVKHYSRVLNHKIII